MCKEKKVFRLMPITPFPLPFKGMVSPLKNSKISCKIQLRNKENWSNESMIIYTKLSGFVTTE